MGPMYLKVASKDGSFMQISSKWIGIDKNYWEPSFGNRLNELWSFEQWKFGILGIFPINHDVCIDILKGMEYIFRLYSYYSIGNG